MPSPAKVEHLLFLVQQKASTISIPEEYPCGEASTLHLRKTRLPHFPDPTQRGTISTPDQHPSALPGPACTSSREVPALQRSPLVPEVPTPSSRSNNLFVHRHSVQLEDLHCRGMPRKPQGRR